jgi:predicted glycosyltransferase
VRIWIDLTAPAHPVVFRPIVQRLQAAGHEVEVTARDYAQTLQLAELHGLEYELIGRHGGRSAFGKARQLAGRSVSIVRWAKGRGFDVSTAHGSNDLPIASRMLGIPVVDMYDYEFATLQHTLGSHLAKRVLAPEAIPAERLARVGAKPPKLIQYPGLKEEYYLADFEPDPTVLEKLGVDRERVIVVVRTPPDVSLYHRKSNPLFRQVVDRLGRDPAVHAVVLPRTEAQARFLRAVGLPSLIVPERAVDGQSLIALSDLVVSAGGTMNREAVALGIPVYTTYGGRLGGVDEWLIREGRLRPLVSAHGIELQKRVGGGERMRRDPQFLVDRILEVGAAKK